MDDICGVLSLCRVDAKVDNTNNLQEARFGSSKSDSDHMCYIVLITGHLLYGRIEMSGKLTNFVGIRIRCVLLVR